MSGKSDPLIFARLHPPRPLTAERLEALLLRLAVDRPGALVVLEARANGRDGISYWLGTTAHHMRWLRRTFHDLLPGLVIESQPKLIRHRVDTAARVRVRPAGLALDATMPETVTRAILSALHAHLNTGEQLVVQILLGPRRAAKHLRGATPDPHQPWWELLLRGTVEAEPRVKQQAADRMLQAGFAAAIRFGVTSLDKERRGRLILGLLGGLGTAKSPGLYVDLSLIESRAIDDATPPSRWGLHPSARELVGLLAWPLGEEDFPGVPGVHPKLVLPPANASTDRAFAKSAVHGRDQLIGISSAASLFHFVTTGPTGSGKSTAFLALIKADAAAGKPILVLDPKRQLIDDIIERAIPADRIDDVLILDPADPNPPTFNPLDVGDRDPDVVVDALVSTFATVFHDGWGPRTQDLITSGLLTLARTSVATGEIHTLQDLPRLFTDTAFRNNTIGHVANDPALGQFWAWYNGLSTPAQAAAVAAPLNKIRQYLVRPSVRRILNEPQPAFRLRDVFRQNKIVLVALNDGLIGPITANLLGGLVVAEAWSATLERASEPNPTSRPASVFLDEMPRFLTLPTSIGDALAQSRSYGVAWHLAYQFRRQVPPEMRAAIDSNARNKLIFGLDDVHDAREVAALAPDLDPLDFQSLGKYQAYLTLAETGSRAWCTVDVLAPPAPTGLAAKIRAASAVNFAPASPPATAAEDQVIPAANPSQIGRKKRQP